MKAWDFLALAGAWAWHQLGRFYDVFHGLGMEGCMLAVAVGWRANRWGLQLTMGHSWAGGGSRTVDLGGKPRLAKPDMAPQWVLGCLLQVGSTILTATAMLALVRAMVA